MWKSFLFILLLSSSLKVMAQDISLYEQFNGRYDYTAIGNTFNVVENGNFAVCTINTSSEATLNLAEDQTVVAAYLYWAGSGDGDFEIELNDSPISATRTFSDSIDSTRKFFAAFADVTAQVQNTGNATYTVSELNLTSVISPFCPTGTNFAGWAITVVYQDEDLPLNQVNVYDGLQSVSTFVNEISFTIENLNVLDDDGAKIGFIAWEGDVSISVNESLRINGNLIGNPPLNPTDNAFNGTNSFTGANNLYNMDIDYYNIQNNISVGDTSVDIQLTSNQDFVMINNIVTVLNTQLPDATGSFEQVFTSCYFHEVTIDFNIYNINSTEILPAGTEIVFLHNSEIIAAINTPVDIGIDEVWESSISFTLPEDVFEADISMVIDPENAVPEINDENNSTNTFLEFETIEIPQLANLEACNEGNTRALFNLTTETQTYTENNELEVAFFTSFEDAEGNFNEIYNPTAYESDATPQEIFYRLENENCFNIGSFLLKTKNCPPWIPQGFSPNGDGSNDTFEISGLYDVFINFELQIFSRLGNKIYEANNSTPEWDGSCNTGIISSGEVPSGTYYYVLRLNDPEYDVITGWVYLKR